MAPSMKPGGISTMPSSPWLRGKFCARNSTADDADCQERSIVAVKTNAEGISHARCAGGTLAGRTRSPSHASADTDLRWDRAWRHASTAVKKPIETAVARQTIPTRNSDPQIASASGGRSPPSADVKARQTNVDRRPPKAPPPIVATPTIDATRKTRSASQARTGIGSRARASSLRANRSQMHDFALGVDRDVKVA